MTLQEIADELGISRQAVAETEARALRKLREHQPQRLLNMLTMVRDLRSSVDRCESRNAHTSQKARAA